MEAKTLRKHVLGTFMVSFFHEYIFYDLSCSSLCAFVLSRLDTTQSPGKGKILDHALSSMQHNERLDLIRNEVVEYIS